MCEQMIIEQCSPTLAGIKTANLFPCKFDDKQILFDEIRSFNQKLVVRGIRIIPVCVEKNRALIYLYRPSKLKKDLSSETAKSLLKDYGYTSENAERCVTALVKRFQGTGEFPHEIGLFLGYPPEDVKGFIENKADGFKCVGCWKVYGDAYSAKRCFESYKKCTRIYKEQYIKGKSIERLTVVV